MCLWYQNRIDRYGRRPWIIQREVQPPALMPRKSGTDDECGDLNEVSKLDKVGRDPEMVVIIGDFTAQQVNAVLRPLQPFRRAHDADKVPHKLADFPPALRNDDLLVAVGDAAFIPVLYGGRWREAIPMRLDMPGTGIAKDEAFQQ